MPVSDVVSTFVAYHVAMTGRVWDSIGQISEQQFLADEGYSRGSIRNLMVHLTHTDLRWLTGLKNMPDPGPGMPPYEAYPDRQSVREYWESVAAELLGYMSRIDEAEITGNALDMPGPRWEVLLHMVNHGTDHRATMLQKLQSYGAPTFDQDFIIWIAQRT